MLYVGLDDNGSAVGVKDAQKLLVDVPNKLQSLLGVVPSVQLEKHGDKECVKISIEPYPYPVSYKGTYYKRSGSSVQELKGGALDAFLLAFTATLERENAFTKALITAAQSEHSLRVFLSWLHRILG